MFEEWRRHRAIKHNCLIFFKDFKWNSNLNHFQQILFHTFPPLMNLIFSFKYWCRVFYFENIWSFCKICAIILQISYSKPIVINWRWPEYSNSKLIKKCPKTKFFGRVGFNKHEQAVITWWFDIVIAITLIQAIGKRTFAGKFWMFLSFSKPNTT